MRDIHTACLLLVTMQPAGMLAESPSTVPECSPIPKIRSFGEEYLSTERGYEGSVVVEVIGESSASAVSMPSNNVLQARCETHAPGLGRQAS